MALIAALLGWLFDGFEMGMFPLTGKPALRELLGTTDATQVDGWFGVIMAVFLIGAATGGVVFGWLGDRIGRVRAMSLSIFTYAIFTGLCGFATEAWHIAALRFIASLGMGGEWSLGVALVNEIWPNKSRALMAGLIGAAANVGYMLVGAISLVLISQKTADGGIFGGGGDSEFMQRLLRNDAWRLLMIAGALPAILIFFIRLFVPESKRWEEERDKGSTSHWANSDLWGVLIGCLGAGLVVFVWTPPVETWPTVKLVRIAGTTVGIVAALLGYLSPVYRYLQRARAAAGGSGLPIAPQIKRLLLGATLTGIALLGTWGSIQWAPSWSIDLAKQAGDSVSWSKYAKEYTQMASAAGAIVGTILAALAAGRFGRRIVYMALCLGSYGAVRLLFRADMALGEAFLAYVFLAGGVTAAFYGFFPLYLPELFPTRIRATSQGFAFNFGRVLAAIGTLQTAHLREFFDGSLPRACSALGLIYLLGVFIIWLGPETKGKPLPE